MQSAFILSSLCLLLSLFVCSGVNAARNRPCAYYCKCDVHANVTRANCSGQGVTSLEVKLPYRVQELDLSFNNITALDGFSFKSLVYLVNLTMSYNALHTIHPDTFTPLREVVSIDLSYNRLEYFDERIFETNAKLTRLDLSGNELTSLNNKLMIVSNSLQYLGLRETNITDFNPLLFTVMPALQKLDVFNTTLEFKSLLDVTTEKIDVNDWYDVSFFPVFNASDLPAVEMPEVTNPHQTRMLERAALKIITFLVFYCTFLAIGIFWNRRRKMQEAERTDNENTNLSRDWDQDQTSNSTSMGVVHEISPDTPQPPNSHVLDAESSASPRTPPPSYEDVVKGTIWR